MLSLARWCVQAIMQKDMCMYNNPTPLKGSYYFKVDSKFMETMGVEFEKNGDVQLAKCPFAL